MGELRARASTRFASRWRYVSFRVGMVWKQEGACWRLANKYMTLDARRARRRACVYYFSAGEETEEERGGGVPPLAWPASMSTFSRIHSCEVIVTKREGKLVSGMRAIIPRASCLRACAGRRR